MAWTGLQDHGPTTAEFSLPATWPGVVPMGGHGQLLSYCSVSQYPMNVWRHLFPSQVCVYDSHLRPSTVLRS